MRVFTCAWRTSVLLSCYRPSLFAFMDLPFGANIPSSVAPTLVSNLADGSYGAILLPQVATLVVLKFLSLCMLTLVSTLCSTWPLSFSLWFSLFLLMGDAVTAQGYSTNHSRKEPILLRINLAVSRLLVHACPALVRVYHAHGISEEADPFEALWLSTVVHAVDHTRRADSSAVP